MAQVTIHPGGTPEFSDDGLAASWTFGATVDGRAGVVRIDVPGDASPEQARQAAKELLEESPDLLEGII